MCIVSYFVLLTLKFLCISNKGEATAGKPLGCPLPSLDCGCSVLLWLTCQHRPENPLAVATAPPPHRPCGPHLVRASPSSWNAVLSGAQGRGSRSVAGACCQWCSSGPRLTTGSLETEPSVFYPRCLTCWLTRFCALNKFLWRSLFEGYFLLLCCRRLWCRFFW